MKKKYTIDYKGFIADWRCRWIEAPKDIHKGKIWKPLEVTVPEPWSENAKYSIKTAKFKFYMITNDGKDKYRYLLTKELLSLLNKYEHEVENN